MVTEADQARHAHAAFVVFRHEGYDGPILGEGQQRQMRKPDELTHIRAGVRAQREAEFPSPLIIRDEISNRQQLAIDVQRDTLAVRSLPDRSLTRERPPARARETVEPGGGATHVQTSHTLKSPGRCSFG